jgi:hypothetical protein
MPRSDELLTRKRSQWETHKPCYTQIWSKLPSISAGFSGETVSPGLRHCPCRTDPEAWKRRNHDTLHDSPADCLMHHVGVKHAHQTADNGTISQSP